MPKKKFLSQIARFTLFFIFLFSPALPAQEKNTPYILVSIAPHEFFVKKIAGDTVKIGLMVPAGASAHTYEPSPRQMLQVANATLWFRMGEPFEGKAIPALKSHNPSLQVVDLRAGLNLIKPECLHSCCSAHAFDPHFWLSARLARTQAETIASTLIKLYPEYTALYLDNLNKFRDELVQLDQTIQKILEPIQNRNILVSHPAYAYFCRDYNLKQYSIEFEGKDPTPQQLHYILNLGRDLKIKTIFIQKQYSSKGACLIADEIKAKVVTLDPYSERYIDTMLEIARAFSKG
jgi:zinc transport system substrate-binding protein